MTDKKIKFGGGANGTRYGLDMLQAHCNTLNQYNWVRQSGKQYVIAKDDTGKHYLDLRTVKHD